MENAHNDKFVELLLSRIVVRENADGQYLYLQEKGGKRGFAMLIGLYEAESIKRIVEERQFERPQTHQLVSAIIKALGSELRRCDIVDLKKGTFYAQLVLQSPDGVSTAVVDTRPSDGIALALHAHRPIRVAEVVLEEARTDHAGPDPLPEP
jgi:bifunctional DNase/RNase